MLARSLVRLAGLRPAAPVRCAVAARPMCSEAKGSDDAVVAVDPNAPLSFAEHTRQGGVVANPWSRYNAVESDITAESAPALAFASNVAPEFRGRRALIYRPQQQAMTSGLQDTKAWTIEFDHRPKWSSPLMGYLSSADPMRHIKPHMRFDSAEQAILFAKRNGWDYTVEAPPATVEATKSYSFNFLPERIEKKIKNLGPRKARSVFKRERSNSSQWVNLRHTDYGDHKWRTIAAADKE